MLVLQTTLPLFALIALGFALTRGRIMPAAASGALSVFVVYLALPALLFRALAAGNDTLGLDGRLMAGYATGTLAWLLAALALARWVGKCAAPGAAAYGTAAAYCNSAFIGLPVGLSLIGREAANLTAFFVSFEMIVLFPLMMVLAESGSREGHLAGHLLGVLRRLLRNPLILAIIAGGCYGLLGLPLHGTVATTLDLLAGSCAPVALVYIGSVLASQKLSGLGGPVAAISTGKLLLHPLFVLMAFALIVPADPTLKAAAVVNAGMPIATIFPILAGQYGREDVLSGAMITTTALSFLTISLWIGYLALV